MYILCCFIYLTGEDKANVNPVGIGHWINLGSMLVWYWINGISTLLDCSEVYGGFVFSLSWSVSHRCCTWHSNDDDTMMWYNWFAYLVMLVNCLWKVEKTNLYHFDTIKLVHNYICNTAVILFSFSHQNLATRPKFNGLAFMHVKTKSALVTCTHLIYTWTDLRWWYFGLSFFI